MASEDHGFGILIAAYMRLHGTSPWYLSIFCAKPCLTYRRVDAVLTPHGRNMGAPIFKSAKHLYHLLIYSTLAVLGALAVVLVELFIANPVILYALGIVVTFSSTAILIWFRSNRRRRASVKSSHLRPVSRRD
jgi:hypothetical protein